MYEKLKNLMLSFCIDKYMHFAFAAAFAWILRWMLWFCMHSVWCAPIAIIITITLCVAKEFIFDKAMKRGTPEWKDLWFGIAGALIGAL